ncbi:MAG: hypothetical protein QM791_02265 [Ferruginibacter sp.]
MLHYSYIARARVLLIISNLPGKSSIAEYFMKTILILSIFIFQFTSLTSQSLYRNSADSIFQSISLGPQDWLISLTIDLAGIHYDAQGNIDSDNPNGTYMLKKINNQYYLQRSWAYEDFTNLSTPINISDSVISRYTTDSLQKAESLFEYIYKHDSLNVYITQGQSDHEPFFRLRMRTNTISDQWYFQQLDVFISPERLALYKEFHVGKNLNEDYNKSTFTYRVLSNLCRLLTKHYGIRILQ